MRFRLGRTVFEMSYPLVVCMTAILLIDRSMSVVICFSSALLHELGHIAALRLFRCFPERIKLTLFDIAICCNKKNFLPTSKDIVVTLAGVAVNFFCAVSGYFLFVITNQEYFYTFVCANLTLGIFNSMPVETLDGGQALFLILSEHTTLIKARRILTVVSLLILFPCACTGAYILLRSHYNFTLLLSSLYLIAVVLIRDRKPCRKPEK